MRCRPGGGRSGEHYFLRWAGKRATAFVETVLRTGRHRSLAGSASVLGSGVQSWVFWRSPRNLRASDRRSRIGAPDANADPRALERTAQTHFARAWTAGATADTPDRRTFRRVGSAPKPRSRRHAAPTHYPG